MSERSFTIRDFWGKIKMGKTDTEMGKRELASEARRKLLMEAAITCFAESGIARTSMRDIARKAGVSIGNLYNHFPGRDDLIAEIARMETEGLTGIVEEVAACGEREQAIKTFVTRYFAQCAERVSAVLTIEITSEALRNPVIGKLFSGNRNMLIACLTIAESRLSAGNLLPRESRWIPRSASQLRPSCGPDALLFARQSRRIPERSSPLPLGFLQPISSLP